MGDVSIAYHSYVLVRLQGDKRPSHDLNEFPLSLYSIWMFSRKPCIEKLLMHVCVVINHNTIILLSFLDLHVVLCGQQLLNSDRFCRWWKVQTRKWILHSRSSHRQSLSKSEAPLSLSLSPHTCKHTHS